MQHEFIYAILTTAITAGITWFFARRKNDAEAKSAEIDAEVKAAEFYKSLLDDASKRLEVAIQTITQQEQKIKSLIQEIEHLTDELKKYKQLNGKQT